MLTITAGLNLKAETKYYAFYYMTWGVKDTIIELGMICACILSLYQISNGAPIGNFIMLVTYWANFTGKSLALTALGPSWQLMLYRKTQYFRRDSTSIGPGSHRRRGTP